MCKECKHIETTPNSLYSLPLAIREGDNTLVSMSLMKINIYKKDLPVIMYQCRAIICFLKSMCLKRTHTLNILHQNNLIYITLYVVQESCVQSFTQQEPLRSGNECYCDWCMKKQPTTLVCSIIFFLIPDVYITSIHFK